MACRSCCAFWKWKSGVVWDATNVISPTVFCFPFENEPDQKLSFLFFHVEDMFSPENNNMYASAYCLCHESSQKGLEFSFHTRNDMRISCEMIIYKPWAPFLHAFSYQFHVSVIILMKIINETGWAINFLFHCKFAYTFQLPLRVVSIVGSTHFLFLCRDKFNFGFVCAK